MVTLSSKSPDEVVSISFDFTRQLEDGETIQSVLISLAVAHGSDPAAGSMLTSTEDISGGIVSRLVRHGVDDTDYLLACLATTSLGQVLKLSGILPVRSQT